MISTLKSAKRTKRERAGVHAWHPYYAGYAESFVESAIEYLNLNENHVVLDPWNGSGTTALVANRKSITTLGFDVNPVMNIFSNAKTGVILEHEKRIKEAVKQQLDSLISQELESVGADDPLLDFMSESLCAITRTTFSLVGNSKFKSDLFSASIKSKIRNKIHVNPCSDFFKACLFVSARSAAGYSGGSNPTWVKTLEKKPDVSKEQFASLYSETANSMLKDIKDSEIYPLKKSQHIALAGDSRSLNVKTASIDGVITSPPYLTRIDYAISTGPEILLLSDRKFLRKTRELTMGAPVIVDKSIIVSDLWGEKCTRLLSAVQEHPSKAARSYYLPNMLQYFKDAWLSLKEIKRVLKRGKKALVVVQTSYFKEHEIPLGEIYLEMAKILNMKAEIAYRDIVRGHMAHVNTKSNQYKKDKVFYEDVVELEKV